MDDSIHNLKGPSSLCQDSEFTDLLKSDIRMKYDKYSTTYDKFQTSRKYRGSNITSDIVTQYIGTSDTNILVLDVGCGTGSAGVALSAMGFINIDGLDASSEMLKEAREKGVFTRLIHTFIEDCTPDLIHDDTYDLLVAQGIFGPSHMQVGDLDVLWRITKPGGHLLTVSSHIKWTDESYFCVKMRNKMNKMFKDRQYELVVETVAERYYRVNVGWIPARVFLFRKLKPV